MKNLVISAFVVLLFCALVHPNSKNIETFELPSKIFGNTRTLRILLPDGYHEAKNSHKKYPVLYLNDGFMVFDAAGPGLRIEEVVGQLINHGQIPAVIVVGIDNGACTDKTKNEIVDRANEYLPYPDAGFAPDHLYEPEPPSPEGKRYPNFLCNEVMPAVEKRYRILTDPENTALGGFSYGGVAALYTIIAKPGRFGKLMLQSTPLWIGRKYELLQDAKNLQKWPNVIYVGAGTIETDEEAFNTEARNKRKVLEEIIRKKSPHTNLKIAIEEGDKHDSVAWRKRLPSSLKFLFAGR